ncbi:hypothetical protein ACNKHR_29200 [Shigella flexneri]
MSSTLREASKDTLQAKDKTYHYYTCRLLPNHWRYHPSTQVTQSFARNLLRWQDGNSVTEEDIHALAGWLELPMLTVKLPTARQGC